MNNTETHFTKQDNNATKCGPSTTFRLKKKKANAQNKALFEIINAKISIFFF